MFEYDNNANYYQCIVNPYPLEAKNSNSFITV